MRDSFAVRQENFKDGRQHARAEFSILAKIWMGKQVDEISNEEIAYAFAHRSKTHSFSVHLPEDRRRNVEFVEGVESFCKQIGALIAQEKVRAGKIYCIEVKL